MMDKGKGIDMDISRGIDIDVDVDIDIDVYTCIVNCKCNQLKSITWPHGGLSLLT